jgi:hypothetical protein
MCSQPITFNPKTSANRFWLGLRDVCRDQCRAHLSQIGRGGWMPADRFHPRNMFRCAPHLEGGLDRARLLRAPWQRAICGRLHHLRRRSLTGSHLSTASAAAVEAASLPCLLMLVVAGRRTRCAGRRLGHPIYRWCSRPIASTSTRITRVGTAVASLTAATKPHHRQFGCQRRSIPPRFRWCARGAEAFALTTRSTRL